MSYKGDLYEARKLLSLLLRDSDDQQFLHDTARAIIKKVIFDINPYEESVGKRTGILILEEAFAKRPELFKKIYANPNADNNPNPEEIAEAAYMLGWMYSKGVTLPNDMVTAIPYFEIAEELNYAPAQYAIGILYKDGIGLEKNEARALKLFSQAAKQDYTEAQYQLATCFDRGECGLPQDQAKAMELLMLAAQKDFAPAQNDLGTYYLKGRGGLSADPEKAISLYRLSANQGFVAAQRNLGLQYEKGNKVVDKNLAIALEYFEQANATGDIRRVKRKFVEEWDSVKLHIIQDDLVRDFYSTNSDKIDRILAQFKKERGYLDASKFTLGSEALKKFNETLVAAISSYVEEREIVEKLKESSALSTIIPEKHEELLRLVTITIREMLIRDKSDSPDNVAKIILNYFGAPDEEADEAIEKSPYPREPSSSVKKRSSGEVGPIIITPRTRSASAISDRPNAPLTASPRRRSAAAETDPSEGDFLSLPRTQTGGDSDISPPISPSQSKARFALSRIQLQFRDFRYGESPNDILSLQFTKEGLFEKFYNNLHNRQLLIKFEESGALMRKGENSLDIVLLGESTEKLRKMFNEVKSDLQKQENRVPKLRSEEQKFGR
ncbi:MAG: hypothetical protein K0R25_255 [Rickettsiaceae bacterium]|jgi:TPR repeat protein|nr:hypothetical protein [Rickettsiaceae bacterium]